MEQFINVVAVVSLAGSAGVAVFGGLIAVGMPLMLLAGIVDGPQGGRLEARRRATQEARGARSGQESDAADAHPTGTPA